jgi:hypothetical protein
MGAEAGMRRRCIFAGQGNMGVNAGEQEAKRARLGKEKPAKVLWPHQSE